MTFPTKTLLTAAIGLAWTVSAVALAVPPTSALDDTVPVPPGSAVPMGGAIPAAAPAPAAPPAPTMPPIEAPVHDPLVVIDAFAAAVKKNDAFSAQDKQFVADTIAADAKDPDKQVDLIAGCLSRLYPEFGKASTMLAEDQIDPAVKLLDPMRGNADPYLAAHAAFFQARTLTYESRYEEAMPILRELIEKQSDKTNYTPEAVFLIGMSQAKTLHRVEAMDTLEKFLIKYPKAPERLQMVAAQTLMDLRFMKDNSMEDVQDRMEYSRRRLEKERTDKPTQTEQDKIVKILQKMIEEAEEKEKQQQSSSSSSSSQGKSKSGKPQSGPPQGNQNPTEHAKQSSVSPGEGRIGDLKDRRMADVANWASPDKNKTRAKTLEALKGKFPERYQELARQYFQDVGKGGNSSQTPQP